MTVDRLSSVPPFTVSGVVFRCWITDQDQRYEWRSICGRYFAGRDGHLHWASVDRRMIGREFATLRIAMSAAINAAVSRAA